MKRAFLVLAALIAIGHFATAPLRGDVSFLSGTQASVGAGLLYAALHFAFVLLAPILVLATAVLVALERFTKDASAPR